MTDHIVAKIAAFRGGRVLMGLRRDDKKWCFPGGHLDGGESPEQAAHRELDEETGLKASRMESLGSKSVKGGKVKVHAFRATVDSEPSAGDDPDAEFTKFKWVDPDDMPDELMRNLHSKPDVLLEMIGAKGNPWSRFSGVA